MTKLMQAGLAIVFSAAGTLVANTFSEDRLIIWSVAIFVFVATAIGVVLVVRFPKIYGGGRNALSASVLVYRGNQILLVHNKRHNKLLPPGSHVRRGEGPHLTAKRAASSEAGFEIEFHRTQNIQLNPIRNIEQVPQPYYAQTEKQTLFWEGHYSHYDLIYVAAPINSQSTVNSQKFKWVSLDKLDEEDTYPDVKEFAVKVYQELKLGEQSE